MTEFLQKLFSTDFMPHVFCLRLPEVIWLYVVANAAIALAYFCIPPTLIYFIRKRRDIAFSWMFSLFGLFILACGTTHVLDIVTLWHPVYRFDDLVLVITAVSSIGTALLLVRIMPQALLLPNPQQLRSEIDKRTEAQEGLTRLNEILEKRVLERTATLNASNAELERAVVDLRYQLELNRAITTQAGDSILVTDLTGAVTFANPESERMFGYDAAGLLGKNMADALSCEGDEKDVNHRTLAAIVNEQKRLHDWETRLFRRDQSCIEVACSAGPIEVSGEYRGSIFILRDITQRKRSERALIESEDKYRTLVDAMPQMVWAARGDGQTDFFSKQWSDYTGQREAGQAAFDAFSVVHPEDVERTREAWQSAQIDRDPYEVEHRIRRFDGSWRWFKTRAVLLPVQHGQADRWLGTSTDIDSDKRAKTVLEQFNADLQNLAFAMAHDLHEPLRAIASQAQLLARHLNRQMDATSSQLVGRVIDGATRMRQLLRDITEYSEAITRPLDIESVKLDEVIGSVLKRRRDKLLETGTVVHLNVQGAGHVDADGNSLRMVFDHLLENSLAYRKDGEELQVNISSQTSGNTVVIAFADNGVGIKPEYHERIFELFKRLHKQREHAGSGIGLALCRKLIERHGHRIWVRSDVNRGAVFYFSLPASHIQEMGGLHELAAG